MCMYIYVYIYSNFALKYFAPKFITEVVLTWRVLIG